MGPAAAAAWRGPYRVIAADPPWPYESDREGPSNRANYPYPTMTIAEICALQVAALAEPDFILWLWTTNFHMRDGAREVVDAWVFEQRTILTWAKDRLWNGDLLRGQTEHVLFAVRPPGRHADEPDHAAARPVRAHSEKPEAFYERVERLCPAPRYFELFSAAGTATGGTATATRPRTTPARSTASTQPPTSRRTRAFVSGSRARPQVSAARGAHHDCPRATPPTGAFRNC